MVAPASLYISNPAMMTCDCACRGEDIANTGPFWLFQGDGMACFCSKPCAINTAGRNRPYFREIPGLFTREIIFEFFQKH